MQTQFESIIQGWNDEPRESARRLIDYYGEPDEASASRLTWYNTFDGWKRTELVNTPVPHAFPAPHNDYLQQFIDYKVPVDMFSALAEFDGSVIAERTRGELSARCGGTSMNFVAINLAHDIVNGVRTVEQAREEYTRLYLAYQEGEKPPYAESFQFEVPRNGTRDMDVPALG